MSRGGPPVARSMAFIHQSDGAAGRRSRAVARRPARSLDFLLRQGIENWKQAGGHTRVPYLKSALAEALALQGDLNAALE